MGAKAAAKAYAAYLKEGTVQAERMAQAAYYLNGQTVPVDAIDGSVARVRDDLDAGLSQALGLTPGSVLSQDQLANVLGGHKATGERWDLGRDQNADVKEYADGRQRIAALDLTLNAPKDFSIAWALAPTDAERWQLLSAHQQAVQTALQYAETILCVAGFGSGHRDGGQERGRMAWIAVDHFTSRPTLALSRPDPETGVVATEIYEVKQGDRLSGSMHVHTHAIIPNMIHTESDRTIAMNRDLLESRLHEIGAVYHGALVANLKAMGVDATRCEKNFVARLRAVPDHLIRAFSPRTANGTEVAKQLAVEQGLIGSLAEWDSLSAERKIWLVKYGVQSHKLSKSFSLTPEDRAAAEKVKRQDHKADFEAWHATAKRLHWLPQTVVTQEPKGPEASEAERAKSGWWHSLKLIAEGFEKRAVLRVSDVRLAVARGFIVNGLTDIGDIDRALALTESQGVRQQKRWTQIVAPQGFEDGKARLTTALHVEQEDEVIGLCKRLAERHQFKLRAETLKRHTAGQDFTGKLGGEQKRAIARVGMGGGLSAFVGVGGTGKTTRVLPPLIAAYKEDKRQVWGSAVARRQADALAEAGIPEANCVAMDPLLDGLRPGSNAPVPVKVGDVVVVDEFSQMGTRHLLELLRASDRIGFKVVLTGDERQCQSIEAGPIIELLARGLGADKIPEILTGIRQQGREAVISALFRGKRGDDPKQRIKDIHTAINMKREDGTAELVPGDRAEVVKRAAEAFMEAVLRNQDDPEYKVTISAPTNADALEIGAAIRKLRQQHGQVAADGQGVVVEAMNTRGDAYELTISPGDRLRLYQRTHGYFVGPDGRDMPAAVGNNGSVVKVVQIVSDEVVRGKRVYQREGLYVETAAGKRAFVPWEKLRMPGTTKAALAYGDCFTIDSAQGITSHEHINALPGGSASVQSFKNYVASSRHKVRSLLISSMGAEMLEAQARRLASQPEPKTLQERTEEAWDNLKANIARAPIKETATQLLEGAVSDTRVSLRMLQRSLRVAEERVRQGLAPEAPRQRVTHRQVAKQLSLSIGQLAQEISATLETERAAMPDDVPPPTEAPDMAPPPGWEDRYADPYEGQPQSAPPADVPPPTEAPDPQAPVLTLRTVEEWVDREADSTGLLVATNAWGFAEGIDHTVSQVVKLAHRDYPETDIYAGDRLERIDAMVTDKLLAAVERAELQLDAKAIERATEFIEQRAGKYTQIVNSGLSVWDEARIMHALAKDAMGAQMGTVYRLPIERLQEIAAPVAARVAREAQQRTQQVPAGVLRDTPQQSPRMGL